MPSSGRSELDLIQLYALVLHLFVLNTFILIQFIHLNASISSVYLYTSSILYTYALVCIYLFKPAQFHALGAHIYASSGQLQIPQIHTYGGIMGHHLHLYTYGESYTIMHVYTYTLIHLYTYTRMWHHIQCNKLKPQHSLVQCTLCMWYMHVPPPDTTDSHLWSYCVCVEVSILGPI